MRRGMFGEVDGEPVHPASFWKFVAVAESRLVTGAEFKDCFGFGYAEMYTRLTRYLPVAVGHLVKKEIHLDLNPLVPRLREATEAESGRIVGDWERIKGISLRASNPDLSREFLKQAESTLRKPYLHGSRDPRLLGVLGLYEYSIGADNNAREFLEAAVSGQAVRPTVYIALAQLRFQEARSNPSGPKGRFSNDQVARVLAPLLVCRNQPPAMAKTYHLIADTWAGSSVKPSAEDLSVLDEGAQLYWSDANLRESIGKLRRQWGYAP